MIPPTFNLPIYLSLADQLSIAELVVQDKDMLSKEYLGEVALLLEDWFANWEGMYAFDRLTMWSLSFSGAGEILRMGI